MNSEEFKESIQKSCSYLEGTLFKGIQDNFEKFLKANICIEKTDKMSLVFSMKSSGVSKETLELLLNCRADYVPANDNPGLLFLYANLYQMLDDDYFEPDKKPSWTVLQEIAKIVETMKNANATFMFLN